MKQIVEVILLIINTNDMKDIMIYNYLVVIRESILKKKYDTFVGMMQNQLIKGL